MELLRELSFVSSGGMQIRKVIDDLENIALFKAVEALRPEDKIGEKDENSYNNSVEEITKSEASPNES